MCEAQAWRLREVIGQAQGAALALALRQERAGPGVDTPLIIQGV
jgi:hypothetical protein